MRVFNNQKTEISKVRSLYSSTLFKNFDNLFVLFLFCIILTEIVSFRNILNLIVLGSVKTNIKDVHGFLFKVLHFMYLIYVYYVCLYSLFANRSEDIERIPGPKPNYCKTFSACHWNLNSL